MNTGIILDYLTGLPETTTGNGIMPIRRSIRRQMRNLLRCYRN